MSITAKSLALSPEQEKKIVELWHQGYGAGRIGVYLAVNAGLIERYIKSLNLKRGSKRVYPPRFKIPEDS